MMDEDVASEDSDPVDPLIGVNTKVRAKRNRKERHGHTTKRRASERNLMVT